MLSYPEQMHRWKRVRHGALEWFGIDADWERVPADPQAAYRNDVVLGLALTVLSVLGVELFRSIGYFEDTDIPAWGLYLLGAVGALPLLWRRRFPLTVVAIVYTHFLVVGFAAPMVTGTAAMQVVYFVALFTAVAWASDRRTMLIVVGAAVLAMFAWLAWNFAVGAGIDGIIERMDLEDERPGLFGPAFAWVAQTWLINCAYFFGAIAAGQVMWHAARRREQLARQAETIERQTAELQQQAVVAERLRIARELHDVVAHHVSVIGIQAAAARRLLAKDPSAAAEPLATIETASRDAVVQMRGLLGTLREVPGRDGAAPAGRAPEPGLPDIARLGAGDTAGGLQVDYRLVEDPAGAAEATPGPVGLSLYRTAQEALANVRRHSTARSASVVVRVERRPGGQGQFPYGFAEVEVLDAGRQRSGTSGTGLGLLGVRERVATHGGTAEIGPRATGGYRVRVRLPLPQESSR